MPDLPHPDITYVLCSVGRPVQVITCLRLRQCVCPVGQAAHVHSRFTAAPSGMHSGLTTIEWQAAAEMEAVLNVTRSACFLSQYETCYTGGYAVCLKQLQIDTLRSGLLSVIVLSLTTKKKSLKRSPQSQAALTPIGSTTLQRALSEAQRRYCPKAADCNSDEEMYSVELSKQDQVATFIDLRLCHARYLRPAAAAVAKHVYRKEYAKFAKKAIEFELKMAASESSAGKTGDTDNKVSHPRPRNLWYLQGD